MEKHHGWSLTDTPVGDAQPVYLNRVHLASDRRRGLSSNAHPACRRLESPRRGSPALINGVALVRATLLVDMHAPTWSPMP
jgi:hypothetical protein